MSLEAKSKRTDHGKVAARTVNVAAIIRQRDAYKCQHALVVGRDFPTSKGDASALAKEIADDCSKTVAIGEPKTITLITIDDLAKLVRVRPVKQVGLLKLQELLTQCRLPEDSAKWVESVRTTKVKKPPYRQIIETIEAQQKKYKKACVKYAAIRVALSDRTPAIDYDTDEVLADLCKGMAQMAPGTIFTNSDSVELDQSAANVIAAIEAATKDYLDDGS